MPLGVNTVSRRNVQLATISWHSLTVDYLCSLEETPIISLLGNGPALNCDPSPSPIFSRLFPPPPSIFQHILNSAAIEKHPVGSYHRECFYIGCVRLVCLLRGACVLKHFAVRRRNPPARFMGAGIRENSAFISSLYLRMWLYTLLCIF